MTYLAKPKLHHPTLPQNSLGYTRRDYEGKISTLCAGCGHDSISAAIIQACWELAIEPHRVAKLSGIGCSSKTPDYFLGNSHGSYGARAHAFGATMRTSPTATSSTWASRACDRPDRLASSAHGVVNAPTSSRTTASTG
jgi:hypothetical protein